MKICRICLNSDKKLYPFDVEREQLYIQLTGINGINYISQHMPKHVCWECAHYMSKYYAFKRKALTSLENLTNLLNKYGKPNIRHCSLFKVESSLTRTDVFTDVSVYEEEEESVLLEPIQEEKIKLESIEDNFADVKNEFTDDDLDFVIDNNSSDNILVTNDLMLSPPTNTTIENKDSGEENKKSVSKLSSVENNRENDFSEDKNCLEIKTIDDKTVGKDGAKKKPPCRPRGCVTTSVRNEIDEELINITEFTIDQQIDEVQNRKESDNYKNSPFKCKICFKGFLDNTALKRHMVKHSETTGKHQCPLCCLRFATRFKYEIHMMTHMYRFSCQLCSFTSSYVKVAKSHVDYHKGTRHTCPHCQKQFIADSSLLSHIRFKHPLDNICPLCGLSFINDNGLKLHLRKYHCFDNKKIPKDGPRCERCDVTFQTSKALENHIKVSAKHDDERPGKSGSKSSRKTSYVRTTVRKKCKKTYTNTYQEQILSYSSEPYPEGPRECEQCDEKLLNPLAHFHHVRTAHKERKRKSDQAEMCEVCGKLFVNENSLRTHKLIHAETKQFECESCGKRYKKEGVLAYHQKYHCGARKDYPCSVCGRNFSSNANRSRHMLLHMGFTYPCQWCGKKFNAPGNLKNHIDYVHEGKPLPKRNRALERWAKEQKTLEHDHQYEEYLEDDDESMDS